MSPHIKMVVFLSLGLLAVFAWHFATVFGFIGSAPLTQGEFFIRIGGIFLGFLVASAITASLIAKSDETAVMPDEREEKIELECERVGVAVLYIGLLVVMWFAFTPMTPMQMANAVLAAVCISELIKILYAFFLLNKPL